jgi:hypothetical protein
MKKMTLLILALSLVLVVGGCLTGKKVEYTKVLQVSDDTQLYTAYNIWYEIPWQISSINYHKGKIIPFGEPIKIISIEGNSITFKRISTGTQYTLVYHERFGLKPIEDFVKQLFTTKNSSALAEGITLPVLKKINAGVVEKGFTRKEVELTYGPPSPHRTPLKEGNTWIYWKNRFATMRVVFKDDKVESIIL